MTGGNISEEPIVISNSEAWQRLASVADCFLFHNRDICMRTDDSVVPTWRSGSGDGRGSRGASWKIGDTSVPDIMFGGQLSRIC